MTEHTLPILEHNRRCTRLNAKMSLYDALLKKAMEAWERLLVDSHAPDLRWYELEEIEQAREFLRHGWTTPLRMTTEEMELWKKQMRDLWAAKDEEEKLD